ncbi:MAG: hypothetical protein RLZZ501_806 [Pseudomonadota bacterium]|jgi:glutathione synthase/RimK-type ligase-like ATP-grasp enzyme
MQNQSRILVAVLREYCARRGLTLAPLCDDWAFVLEGGGRRHIVFGYDLGLNRSTALQVANDKAATHQILTLAGLPSVEHVLFHAPAMAEYVPLSGGWRPMLDYFHRHGADVVCKPNTGTGGIGVQRVRSEAELEAAVHPLFAAGRSLCLSPFLPIAREVRVVVVGGRGKLAYEKKRPALTGDGATALFDLLRAAIARQPAAARLLEHEALSGRLGPLDRVPARGETVTLGWKHNLAWGNRPEPLDPAAAAPLLTLAEAAAAAIGIEVASIDLVETADGLAVIEINAGLMMESFARVSPAFHACAAALYAEALDQVFAPAGEPR